MAWRTGYFLGVDLPQFLLQLQWNSIEQNAPTNAKHPRSYARIWLNQALPDAKFAVICNRPCDAAETSSLGGYNYSRFLKFTNSPDIAAFVSEGPNPFPAGTYYTLGVESADDTPVKIVDVHKLILTDDQKQQWMNLPH